MGAIAETFDDRFIMACHHSKETNPYDNMGDIVEKLGAVRTKQLNMGGSSNADVNSLTNLNIGQDNLTCAGVITSISDERTPEEKLKLEIAYAFGSEVAQMADFIAEVMQSLGPDSKLSQAQKEQLFETVGEIITLKNLMNTGMLPEGQARLEAMIAETANKIADLLLDGLNQKMVSPAITEFVHQMLIDVGAQYDIPELSEKMVKIEGRMNPESYLQDSIAEMILQLNEMVESQDLSDEAKAEIEALIEKMELAAENGEPLPRDVMKALDNLGETFPDIHLPQAFADSLDTLKDANIVMKAETLGISIDQVQSIESAIETLETQLQELSNQDSPSEETTLEIEALIEKLTAFSDEGIPLDREAIKSLETIAETFPNLDFGGDFQTVIESVQEANLTVKADNLGISIEELKQLETAIDALDTQLQDIISNEASTPENIAEIEALIEKLTAFSDEGIPLDREAIKSLETIAETFPNLDFGDDFQTIIESVQNTNLTVKADNLGISVEEIGQLENNVESLNSQLKDLVENESIAAKDIAAIETIIQQIEQGSVEQSDLKILQNFGIEPSLPSPEPTNIVPFIPVSGGDAKPVLDQKSPTLTEPMPIEAEPDSQPIEIKIEDNQNPDIDDVLPDPQPEEIKQPIPEGDKPEDDGPIIEKDGPDKIEPDEIEQKDPDIPVPPGGGDGDPDGGDDATPLRPDEAPAPENPSEPDRPAEPDIKTCGPECKCGDAFNEKAKYENKDGMVTLRLENGDVLNMTEGEAKTRINDEMIGEKGLQLDQKNWDSAVDRFDGDVIKAREFIVEEKRLEAEIATQTKGKVVNYDGDVSSLSALDAKMRAKQSPNEKPADPSKKPDVKTPFHQCGPNCDHGGENKPRHKAGDIDISAFKAKKGKATKPSKPKKPAM
jgi:hypothetical protein